jgi:hypothetical protein
VALEKFRASPLPNPPLQYDPQYIRQLIRVLENYFSQLDGNVANYAKSYRADNFYGGAFNGYIQNTTTTERVALAAVAGQLVFDTTLKKLCVYTGTAWETITSTVTPIKVYVTTVSATGSLGTVRVTV